MPAAPARPDITAADAAAMLLAIPADDRDLWVKVGGICKDAFADDGFAIWDEWSQRADNYSARDARTVWRSLGRNDRRAGLGTLVFLAREHGWCPNAAPPQAPVSTRRKTEPPPPATGPNPDAVRARLRSAWESAVPLDAPAAEPARAYLRHRGLGSILDDPPADIRLEVEAPYFLPPPDDHGRPILLGRWPALIAVVRDLAGRGVAVHKTYLDPAGAGKAAITNPDTGRTMAVRKLRTLAPGASRGAAIRLYPCAATLVVAEGIETALAARLAVPEFPVWAAVSAGGIARLRVPEEVREVIVAADHDPHGAGERAVYQLARRLSRSGVVVRLAMPPVAGMDWLDVLNGVAPDGEHG